MYHLRYQRYQKTLREGINMPYILYHYPKCSTCIKARKWLDSHNIQYQSIDLSMSPPNLPILREINQKSHKPLKKLFNTSGQSYRNGEFKDKLAKMSEDDQFKALADDGMLVKRPILLGEKQSLIGFKVDEWSSLLA